MTAARIRRHNEPGRQRPGSFVFIAVIATALAAAVAAGAAHAQVGSSGDYLARMDGNGDGRVSLTEYQDWLSYAFDAMDRDRDGTLTADELPGRRGQPVTRAEYRARLAATFLKQDSDRDGSLGAKELAAPPR